MNNDDIATRFKAARDLIADPTHWCQGWYAKDAQDNDKFEGMKIYPKRERADKWCSVGVLVKFDLIDEDEVLAALEKHKHVATSLAQFNDTHTHAEVIALFDLVGKENGWL